MPRKDCGNKGSGNKMRQIDNSKTPARTKELKTGNACSMYKKEHVNRTHNN